MRRPLVLLASLAFVAACKVVPASPDAQQQPTLSTADVRGELGDTVRIGLHKTASFDGGRFVVRFDSLEADSRCPADAICAWQGDAAARLDLEAVGGMRNVTLHTATEPRSFGLVGYRVELVNVEPYPGTYDRSKPAPSPVAVVVVSRR
jgi:hypothetical protein